MKTNRERWIGRAPVIPGISPAALRFVSICLLVVFASSWLASCGGKKRPPPLPTGGRSERRGAERTPPRPGLPAIREAPTVRLLLKENFGNVTIRGSSLAPVVEVEATGERIQLRRGKQAPTSELATGSGFRLEPSGSGPVQVDGIAYRGAVEVFVNPVAVPVVVNEVDLEDYLRGAVPNELPPSRFPDVEALKAQAVAARTFAVHHLGAFAKRGFDLYADERSQVYNGIKGEHRATDEAIASTRGVIVTYKDAPILSVYSSTCGGKTEAYGAVFQKDLPYLKGGVECQDELSPFHSWEVTRPAADIEASLNRRRRFGRLQELTTLRRGVSGRTVEMKVKGSQGEVVLRANEIRASFGLRSNFIVDLKLKKDASGNISHVVVKGKGWGHGVGLCQFGAVGLARKGYGYERILKHYYNDVELKRNH